MMSMFYEEEPESANLALDKDLLCLRSILLVPLSSMLSEILARGLYIELPPFLCSNFYL